MTFGLKPEATIQTKFVQPATSLYISNLLICAEVGGAVDVHVQPADSADKFALYVGLHIAKNETFACTALKLCPGDALYVTSANGSHTFTIFSDEV